MQLHRTNMIWRNSVATIFSTNFSFISTFPPVKFTPILLLTVLTLIFVSVKVNVTQCFVYTPKIHTAIIHFNNHQENERLDSVWFNYSNFVVSLNMFSSNADNVNQTVGLLYWVIGDFDGKTRRYSNTVDGMHHACYTAFQACRPDTWSTTMAAFFVSAFQETATVIERWREWDISEQMRAFIYTSDWTEEKVWISLSKSVRVTLVSAVYTPRSE